MKSGAGVDGESDREISHTSQLLDLDIWHTSRSHIDILLSPKIKSHFFSLIPHDLHPGSPLVDSDLLQTLLSRPGRKHRKRPPPSQPPIPSPPIDPFNLTTLQSPYHDAYHPLSNITQFGKQLEKTFPGLVKRFTVGKSAEGRDVEGLRLHKFVNTTEEDPEEWSPRTLMGRKKGRAEEAKTRVFYLQGGQHAREVRYHCRQFGYRSNPSTDPYGLTAAIVDRSRLAALLCSSPPRPSLPEQFSHRTPLGDVRVCDRAHHQPRWLRIRKSVLSIRLLEIRAQFVGPTGLCDTESRAFEAVEEEQAGFGL